MGSADRSESDQLVALSQCAAPVRWANPQDFDAWEALALSGNAATAGREALSSGTLADA